MPRSRAAVLLTLLLATAPPAPAAAMHLSGVLLHGADAQGRPTGGAWHTARSPGAGPLGLTRFNPAHVRHIPFPNNSRGEIDLPLLPGTHVVTLLFQYPPEMLPSHLVLNLFFDDDKREPRISVLVPHQRGFTRVRLNPAPATRSLYLEEVENGADLVHDDGRQRARLGAAFYFPSSGFTPQWMSRDFFEIDRVGPLELEPDGEWDGILVFELEVTPSRPRPTPRWSPGAKAPPTPPYVPPVLVEHGTPAMLPGRPLPTLPPVPTYPTRTRTQTPPTPSPTAPTTQTPTLSRTPSQEFKAQNPQLPTLSPSPLR
jgi:hypothetical protein